MRISNWSSDVCSAVLDSMLLAAPERTSPSTAADLAISVDLSTSSESPATTFIRKSAGAPLAALYGVKQPESIASELISSRGEPSPYSDHPCVSPSTIAMEIGRASCRERVCQYV